jgi:hypothetical protein
MLWWIIQLTIISFILIFLVHHLLLFLKSTLTVPKIKDLVNDTNLKYEKIYNIISNKEQHNNLEQIQNYEQGEYTLIDTLPTDYNINMYNNSDESMKNELKKFLKSQL